MGVQRSDKIATFPFSQFCKPFLMDHRTELEIDVQSAKPRIYVCDAVDFLSYFTFIRKTG